MTGFSRLSALTLAGLLTVAPLTTTAGAEPAVPPPEQTLLTASDGQSHDEFGRGVALDGDTAVVGVPYEDGYSGPGVAYVFVRSGGTWAQQATLRAADGDNYDWFGASVAVSGDAVVVSAPRHPWPDQTGATYVFTRSGSTWSQQAELTAADPDAHLGGPVALDGGTALVVGTGGVHVFTGSGSTWSEQDVLTGPPGAGGIGSSLDLDGDTAVVGSRTWGSAGGSDDGIGAAYVFTRTGSSWAQQAQLTADDGAPGDFLGASVAISGDTALLGGGDALGAAYAYTRAGTSWSQQAKLVDPETPCWSCGYAGFGTSVALVGDVALVGSPYTDFTSGNDNRGAVYVFARSGTTWSLQAGVAAVDGGAGDNFGYAAAVSGTTALIGAPSDDVDHGGYQSIDQGSAYVLQLDTTAPHTGAGLAPAANGAGWNRGPVTVTLTATDGGSGVAATYFRRGGTGGYAQYDHTAKPVVAANGSTDVWYYSADQAGNSEAPAKVTVRIDTTRPRTAALADTSVRRGGVATLRLRVNDAVSPRARVTVRIYQGSALRKTLALGLRGTGSEIAYRYRCTLLKGRYVWKVYATDLAGNTQAQVARRSLTVR